jgi:hypothetical protein
MLLDVVLRQGFSLYFLGNWQESVNLLLEHQRRLEQLEDASLAGRYHFWLAHMYSRLGDQERAAHNAFRAIEHANQSGDATTLGKAHGLLALEGHWSGKSVEGIEHGRRAVALLEGTSEYWYLGMAPRWRSREDLTKQAGRSSRTRTARSRRSRCPSTSTERSNSRPTEGSRFLDGSALDSEPSRRWGDHRRALDVLVAHLADVEVLEALA